MMYLLISIIELLFFILGYTYFYQKKGLNREINELNNNYKFIENAEEYKKELEVELKSKQEELKELESDIKSINKKITTQNSEIEEIKQYIIE